MAAIFGLLFGILLMYLAIKGLIVGEITFHAGNSFAFLPTTKIHAKRKAAPLLYWLLISSILLFAYACFGAVLQVLPDSSLVKKYVNPFMPNLYGMIVGYLTIIFVLALCDVGRTIISGETGVYFSLNASDDASKASFFVVSRSVRPLLYRCLLIVKSSLAIAIGLTIYALIKYPPLNPS